MGVRSPADHECPRRGGIDISAFQPTRCLAFQHNPAPARAHHGSRTDPCALGDGSLVIARGRLSPRSRHGPDRRGSAASMVVARVRGVPRAGPIRCRSRSTRRGRARARNSIGPDTEHVAAGHAPRHGAATRRVRPATACPALAAVRARPRSDRPAQPAHGSVTAASVRRAR